MAIKTDFFFLWRCLRYMSIQFGDGRKQHVEFS